MHYVYAIALRPYRFLHICYVDIERHQDDVLPLKSLGRVICMQLNAIRVSASGRLDLFKICDESVNRRRKVHLHAVRLIYLGGVDDGLKSGVAKCRFFNALDDIIEVKAYDHAFHQ